MSREISNFINGKPVSAASGETTDLIDPSTGEVFASAALSRDADIDAAFQSAERAFEGWRDTTPSERQQALLKIADDESLENTDLVLWYVFGIHHITRVEDWPVMPADTIAFWLKPFGFFDQNPSIDVPPSVKADGEVCRHHPE